MEVRVEWNGMESEMQGSMEVCIRGRSKKKKGTTHDRSVVFVPFFLRTLTLSVSPSAIHERARHFVPLIPSCTDHFKRDRPLVRE